MADEDLNEWHEFWITMQNNGAMAGNIEVKVYMDGDVSNPSTFQVTLSGATNAVYKDENDPFLEFGFSSDALFGSIDIDFLSYAFGVIAPAAPACPAITTTTAQSTRRTMCCGEKADHFRTKSTTRAL